MSPSSQPFLYGERVTDPVSTLRTKSNVEESGINKLSVDLLTSDVALLKSTTATRGNIQLTISALVSAFCDTLRTLGITNYLQADDFHLALAVWSGREVDWNSVPLSSIVRARRLAGFEGSPEEPLFVILTRATALAICRAFCRGTAPLANRNESGADDARGTKSVRSKTPRTPKESPGIQRSGKKGRGDA